MLFYGWPVRARSLCYAYFVKNDTTFPVRTSMREKTAPIGIMKPMTFTIAVKSAISHPKGMRALVMGKIDNC